MQAHKVTQNSGSIYKKYDTTSQEYLQKRMPEIGELCVFSDGRKFRFVSTAVDVAAGQLVQAAAQSAELAGKFTAAAVGATAVTITLTGISANDYAGGTLVVTESSGMETSYHIKSNTASDASDNIILTLESPLAGAVAAADDAILIKPKYEKVLLGTATGVIVGVALVASTAATDGYTNFLWVQVAGVGAVNVKTATSLTVGVCGMGGADGGIVVADGTKQAVCVCHNTAVVTAGDSVAAHITIE